MANNHKKVINWFPLLHIMEYTVYKIENQIALLPSLLKTISMLQMRFWYDNEPGDKNDVTMISIRYIYCGKETSSSINNMNTNYKDIITLFVFNTLLHHVGMSWIIEANEQLKYDMYKHNSDWITGFHWYNTYIFKELHGTVF